MGGMHILKSVSADDNLQDWDWNIVELCLRGAVENFSDCSLLEGKEPPAVCCPVQRDDCFCSVETKSAASSSSSSSSSRVMEACCQWRQQLENQSHDHPYEHSETSSAVATPLAAKASSSSEPALRSKSPILEQKGGSRSKKRLSSGFGNDRKRMRSGTWQEGDEATGTAMQEKPRKFIALHAALTCGASSHVIRCVLAKYPDQISKVDEWGQLPLHLAVRHPACVSTNPNSLDEGESEGTNDDMNEVLKIVLEDILKPHPGAAFVADDRGRLPLHLAIAAKADFNIIQALLRIHPSSGVDPMETSDTRFSNNPPIYMATEYNCDLSTTYLLLRGDPSVVAATAKA